MNWQEAINKVLAHEGGFVFDPADSGGATNFGITKAVYEKFKGRSVTVDEIKNMPKSDAVLIYKRDFWDAIGGDKINSYKIAYALFDQAVNRGVSASVRSAQRILGVNPDGKMGPSTIDKINRQNETDFLSKFLADAEKFYRDLVARRPKDAKFLKGWLNRISSISDYVGVKPAAAGIGALVLVTGIFFLILRSRGAK